jgi:hypothetical protein
MGTAFYLRHAGSISESAYRLSHHATPRFPATLITGHVVIEGTLYVIVNLLLLAGWDDVKRFLLFVAIWFRWKTTALPDQTVF